MTLPEASTPEANSPAADVSPAPRPEAPVKFIGLFDVKASASNIGSSSAFVNGQVVGTLGGINASTVTDTTAMSSEQRAVGIVSYTPGVLDGRATLTAGFEIDFAFGDQSYSTGGNTGGAFGADQVNLQTRRLHGRFRLDSTTDVVVGLQFVGDGVADPERAKLDDLVRGGGRLLFWGSEAAGVSVYGRGDPLAYRLGAYTLYEAALADADDITLLMADGQWHAAYATRVGLHAWYLRDRGAGNGGLLGTGPTSVLSQMQGGPALDLRDPPGDGVAPDVSADLTWIAADLGYNAGLDRGDVGATVLIAANLGRLYVTDQADLGVSGGLIDAEARWRWAPGAGSVVRAELLASTGDTPEDNLDGGAYTGIVTGNSYGIAGSVNATHGCLLLFPDPVSINRQVAAVYDASNAGAGLAALTAQAGWDVVPNRLTASVGAGHAETAAFVPVGTEVNARLVLKPFPLATVGLYGGVLIGSAHDRSPWMSYVALDWLVF